jgi:hypothetical protein
MQILLKKSFSGVNMEIVSFRAEMIVHHIQEDHEPFLMGGTNQAFEVIGMTVDAVRSKKQDPVIAPVEFSGKISHRHQFNGGNAKIDQIIKPGLDSGKSSFR